MRTTSSDLPPISEGAVTVELKGMESSAKRASPILAPTIDPWSFRSGMQDLFPGGEVGQQTEIARGLEALHIPDLKIISSPGLLALYSRDQADVPDLLRGVLFNSLPDAVAQPFSVEAIPSVLRYAAKKKTPIIVRGAGSSSFGGSMPVTKGIVLDMNDLDRVLTFDAGQRTVKVQAGIRWADLDWFLEQHGLCVPCTPSSRFSTVGGWVATGGIGISSISAGHLSRSVLELEVIDSEGVLRKLTPRNRDFRSLFGSEGQLAVIASVTLQTKAKPASPAPRLTFFPDHASALNYSISLASAAQRSMDLTYFSPAKFDAINRILGKYHFPVAHGVLSCYESEEDPAMKTAPPLPKQARPAHQYLAHLLWNERFFPMKFRKLGPGLMGAEVLAPRAHLVDIVTKAERVCSSHDIEPMIEIHFLEGGDGMLLCYYITDQARQLKYTMDSFRGLLITSALLDAGARPYSFGVWNHAFSDHANPEEQEERARAKRELDPRNIMNPGKSPRLKGRWGGVPATLFSPEILGAALKLVNRFGFVAAEAVNLVSSSNAFDRQAEDLLLRTTDECAMCGACIGVCPAYLATKDERVTARGKLLTARQMQNGGKITKEHAHRTFLCLRCKACEQVCQSKLSLIPVYDELERRLGEVHGKNEEEIKRFVELVENSPAYDALIDRGLVLGAASKSLEGGK